MRSGLLVNGSTTLIQVSRTVRFRKARKEGQRVGSGNLASAILLVTALLLLAPAVFGQGSPRVAGVDPAAGKVNDSVTMTGENLGKGSIVGVFLSDDKADFKAALVDQAADKVVFKVPQVKAGDYNVSIQVGNNILIQPVRFKVQE